MLILVDLKPVFLSFNTPTDTDNKENIRQRPLRVLAYHFVQYPPGYNVGSQYFCKPHSHLYIS